MKKGAYVLKSTYQKLAEKNKALLSDIRILTEEGWKNMPEKIFIIAKWRKRWDTERALVKMIREHAKKREIRKGKK